MSIKDKKKSKGDSGKKVDFAKHLRGLNKHVEEAKKKAAESGLVDYDDGRYQAQCISAKIGVSKGGRVQVVLEWKFLNGDYKGKTKLDFEGLNEDHLPFLFKKLDQMGYDTSEIEDLEKELNEILSDIKKSKPKCKIVLKTKGEFQNVYVNGPLEDDEEESEDTDEEEEDDEEEKPKKGKGKKSSKKDDDDEEEEEEEEESDDEDEEEEESEEEEEESDDEDEEEEEKPKKSKSKKSKKDEDEDEEEEEEDGDEEDAEEAEDEEEDEEVDLAVGSVVKAESKKEGKVKGTVTAIHEDENKFTMKTDKGKVLKLLIEKIISVEEAPAESVPKKGKKNKK